MIQSDQEYIRSAHYRDVLTGRIIGCAITVHRRLGPGLLESVYRECLCYELTKAGIECRREVPLTIVYGDVRLECGHRLDIVVENVVILELKAVDALHSIHEAQMLTYLRLSGMKKGLLINFNVRTLSSGIKRLVV